MWHDRACAQRRIRRISMAPARRRHRKYKQRSRPLQGEKLEVGGRERGAGSTHLQKNDPTQQGNSRPISLLSVVYKVLTIILRKRLAAVIEEHIWPTQYGFPAGCSTADAVHLTRRAQDRLEQAGRVGMLCLSDWDKSFDKLAHAALFDALARYDVYPKLVRMVRPCTEVRPSM